MAAESRGRLVISVDLELQVEHGSLPRQRALEAVTAELLALLAQHHVSATFAVADPVRSAATEAILACSQPHELAVLADATWIGRGAGRERLARELERRFGSARNAGLNVTTLALRHVAMEDHFDLLLKNDITALRIDPPSARTQPIAQPHAVRYNVWQMPASVRLPEPARWWFARSQARGLLETAAQRAEIVHLLIDGAKLLENEATGLKAIDRALHVASQLREHGRLELETVQSLAAQLSRPREVAPLRSILRPAA